MPFKLNILLVLQRYKKKKSAQEILLLILTDSYQLHIKLVTRAHPFLQTRPIVMLNGFLLKLFSYLSHCFFFFFLFKQFQNNYFIILNQTIQNMCQMYVPKSKIRRFVSAGQRQGLSTAKRFWFHAAASTSSTL